MDFESDFFDHTEFDLSGDGEGSSYRVDMTNEDGQFNRTVMASRGKKLIVTATLLEVVHGKMKDGGGDDATLLIASFRFIPSDEKRFKNVKIDWTFTSDDPAIDVVVADIAPDAGWVLNPVTLKLEKTIGVKGNIGASLAPANAGLAADYEGKVAKDLEYHTSVDGVSRMDGLKNKGGYNSVRWILKENPKDPRGICRMLQVAVLLKRPILAGKKPGPRPEQTFKSIMEIGVDKGFWSKAKKEIQERAWKNTSGDEAVVYHPDEPSESGDFDIDKNNLHATSLRDDIMYMSMRERFEDLREERQGRKRAKEAEEKKRQEEEEKRKREEEKEKEEEEKRKRDEKEKEEGEKRKRDEKEKEEGEKRKRDEEKKKADEGEAKASAVAAVAAGTNAFAHPQGGRDILPSTQTPAWLYAVLGILGMYVFQQLMKSWFGGS